MMDNKELSIYIKAKAFCLGFDVCGIAQAKPVGNETSTYCNRWIAEGNNGSMSYLERNCDKRYDPTLLVEGCRSIVVAAI